MLLYQSLYMLQSETSALIYKPLGNSQYILKQPLTYIKITIKWMNGVLGNNSALLGFMGTTCANEEFLVGIMPQVQDRSLLLLTSSPVCYHCATAVLCRITMSEKCYIWSNNLAHRFLAGGAKREKKKPKTVVPITGSNIGKRFGGWGQRKCTGTLVQTP